MPAEELDYASLAARTLHGSGADLDGLIEEAREAALGEVMLGGTERPMRQADFEQVLQVQQPSTLEWLKTVRNVVKYAGDDGSYREVEKYLKATRLR